MATNWTSTPLQRAFDEVVEQTRTGELETGRNDAVSSPVVLLIEQDDRSLEQYTSWLSARYNVLTAETPADINQALLDAADVVLLGVEERPGDIDRRLDSLVGPDTPTRVGVLLMEPPMFEPLEVGIDQYAVKPVSQTELLDVVDELLVLAEYDTLIGELYDLVRQQVCLEETLTPSEQQHSEGYQHLDAEIDALNEIIEACLQRFTPETCSAAIRNCSHESPGEQLVTDSH